MCDLQITYTLVLLGEILLVPPSKAFFCTLLHLVRAPMFLCRLLSFHLIGLFSWSTLVLSYFLLNNVIAEPLL